MRAIIIISFIIISFAGTAYSYTKNQMVECVSNALSNPATKTFTKKAITNYCNCALIAIIDENKDIKKSGYECAQISFR